MQDLRSRQLVTPRAYSVPGYAGLGRRKYRATAVQLESCDDHEARVVGFSMNFNNDASEDRDRCQVETAAKPANTAGSQLYWRRFE